MTIDEMNAKRKELGFSYEKLSRISGVPLSTVQKVLGGITASPRYETLARLQAALTGRYPLYGAGIIHYDPFIYSKSGESSGLLGESPATYGASDPAIEPADWTKLFDASRQGSFTVRDMEAIPMNVHAELIDGEIFIMESPTIYHQAVLGELYLSFQSIIKKNGGPCKVFINPLDARGSEEDESTKLRPDLMVICDRKKLQRWGCLGAPDLVCEVLSPSTRNLDMGKKFSKYQEWKVREYWLIDPDKRRIAVYPLEEDGFPEIYGFDDEVPVHIWKGGEKIDFREIGREIAYLYEEGPEEQE